MSVNFYNTSGFMMMVDTHAYKPAPPAWPHLVAAPLWWLTSAPSMQLDSVTSDASRMIQGGMDLYLIPHVFIGVPPSAVPPAPLQLATIFALSGSVAYLTVHKVSGCGAPLACCVYGMIGFNVNCNDPCDLPNGTVFQWNTVQTQPTSGDYVGAAVGYALDAAFACFVIGFLDGLGIEDWASVIIQHLVRLLPLIPGVDDLPIFPGIIIDPSGIATPRVQKLIDGE